MITPEKTETFNRDGVVFLQNAFEPQWIQTLLDGIAQNIKSPSERGRIWDTDDQGRSCFYDSQVWRDIDGYKDFAQNSPCAEIAGCLLGSASVNFFFDAIFVRTRGRNFARHSIKTNPKAPRLKAETPKA